MSEISADSVDNSEVKSGAPTGSRPQPPEGKTCSVSSCVFLRPAILAFLLPVIGILLLDYLALPPFCNGAVCHTCMITKTVLACLAGFIGLLAYKGWKRIATKPQ